MFHINYYSAPSTSIKTRWGNQLVKIQSSKYKIIQSFLSSNAIHDLYKNHTQ